jgi:beta-galactosidase
MSYNQFTEPGTTTIKGTPVKYFAELLCPTDAKTMFPYEHKYWGEYSGITQNTYEAGCAFYIGGYVDKELLKEVYADALKAADISVPACRWPVILRSGVTPKGGTLHYVLHYAAGQDEFVCPYEKVTNLLDGREYREGERILLGDWDVLVLQERK